MFTEKTSSHFPWCSCVTRALGHPQPRPVSYYRQQQCTGRKY
uniref:Uncharacterized protein n=1 Tax=Anopheles albimanus TaxID=7167 RepID=A0A182FXS1_ANOAL